MRENSSIVNEFFKGLACKVGSGEGVRFWNDVWVGDISLRKAFPRVFAVSLNKSATVAEAGQIINGRWSWSFGFRREFFEWELAQYESFFQLIQMVIACDDPDVLFWKGDSAGIFTVKGLCKAEEEKWFAKAGWLVSKKLRVVVPAKVAIFMWQLQKNRVATKAGLIRHGMILPDEGACSLCAVELESTGHLFLHCTHVWPAWCAIMQREEVYWVVPQSVEELLVGWGELRQKSEKTDDLLWDLIPFALCWSIWLERNNVVFNNKKICGVSVWDLHLARLSWWVKAWWGGGCPFTADQFVLSFEFINLP